MMIDRVVHQIGIIPGFKNLHSAGAVSVEAKIHHTPSFNRTIIDANHLDRVTRISLAIQLKLIRRSVERIFNSGVEEVEVSFIFQIPRSKQPEKVPETCKWQQCFRWSWRRG